MRRSLRRRKRRKETPDKLDVTATISYCVDWLTPGAPVFQIAVLITVL